MSERDSGHPARGWVDALAHGERVLRVLVADDEPVLLALMRQTLGSDNRFQLLVARDGGEAVAEARSFLPDVVLLDVRMPVMTGFEVCAVLRADPGTAHATIIMVTAASQQADIEQGYAAGADDYFTKPFSPRDLRRRVQEALGLGAA